MYIVFDFSALISVYIMILLGHDSYFTQGITEYKPHKVDTDSHSIDAVIFTALTY